MRSRALLRREVDRDGINVHIVTPGPVETEMLQDVPFEMYAIRAADVADAVAWLDTLDPSVDLPEIRLHAITRGPHARAPWFRWRPNGAPPLPSRHSRYTCDSIWWKIRYRSPRRTSSHVIQLAPVRSPSASLLVSRHRLSRMARTTVSSTTSNSCNVDDTVAALSRPATLAQCRSSSSLPISGAAYSSPT